MYLTYTPHKEYNNAMYMTVYGKHKLSYDYGMGLEMVFGANQGLL